MNTQEAPDLRPDLFPELSPPPGGLHRLRRRLDARDKVDATAASSRWPTARWRMGTVAAAVAVVAVFALARRDGASAPATSGIAVWGVPTTVVALTSVTGPSGAVSATADDVTLTATPIGDGVVFLWLPPD